MKIIYRTGNLLTTNTKFIAHCVNAQGRMASGVAKAIKERYPKAYDDYIEWHAEGRLKLGRVLCSTNSPHLILHLCGQEFYGNDGRTYIDYQALEKCFTRLNSLVDEEISFPMIGCGLAGGKWEIVSRILEETSKFQPIVYMLNDTIPH